MFGALALCSDEGLLLETSALKLFMIIFTLSTQLMILNCAFC